MKHIFGPILSLVILVALFSCDNSGKPIYRNVSGKAGELLVVMSKESWNDTTGSLIRKELAQPHPSLPQDEPLFDLINIPSEAFNDLFKTTRNILITRISSVFDSSGIEFQNDLWAYPQTIVQIQARNNVDFDFIFHQNAGKILSHFLNGEKRRLNENLDKYYEKTVYNSFQKEFRLTLKTGPGFDIAKKDSNFAWLRYETPDISQGIFLFTYPYQSDSTFTLAYQTAKRDSMLKLFVPGPTKGSFMTTEKIIDPIFNVFEHNKNYASETRGLWKVQNDFMGGPYIALTELDASNQRIVEAIGYVYAPSKNKRNLLRQVEAMVYTLKFEDQDKNNKINSQIKMGN